MSVSTYQFIDPLILSSISNLQLVAKTVVDGFMLGVHQSPKPGAGLEFNQYRSYQPGDDLRRVDWKMYARSDRYYVRESEVETSVNVKFVLDATASMAHEDRGMSKFDYARFLVASLGYLASAQGDAIGLHIINNAKILHLPPKQDHQHLHRFLHELEKVAPAGIWPEWQEFETTFTTSQTRAIIVFVSDMHELRKEIQEMLTELSSLKNEILIFHLLGKNELEFAYDEPVTFEDLETGKTIQVDPAKSRDVYLKSLDDRIRSLRQTSQDQHIAYDFFSLEQPLDFALRNYLSQRMNMA